MKIKDKCLRTGRKIEQARMESYIVKQRNCKRSVAKAKIQEFADELDSEEGRRRVFRIAKQLARDGQDIVNVNCLRDKGGKVAVDKKLWKDCMAGLLN